MRLLQRATLACVLLFFGACSTSSSPEGITGPELTVTPSAVESALVDLTNAERRRDGLAPLRTASLLMQAAELQASQVLAAGRLEHTLPEARYPRLEDRLQAVGYRWQAAGENLAFGQRDAAQATEAWMQSSGHRANILNATFTEIGTSYVVDTNGRAYYVQVFGLPR